MRLLFGVFDIPYSYDRAKIREKKRNLRSKKPRKEKPLTEAQKSATTGDVAEILERHYHPFQIFFDMHQPEIVGHVERSMEATLEAALTGAPLSMAPFQQAEADIGNAFKQFLSQAEIESYPGAEMAGLPTIASGKTPYRKGGINHRLKHPYSHKNPPRPSLIDTGLYQASAVVEVKPE